MKRLVLAAAAAVIGITAAVAQQDPIATRRAAMKSVGDANRIAGEMIDGKRPFDLAAAKQVLTTFGEVGGRFHGYFPDASKTGDTNALPAVWDNKSDFDAKLAKFAKEARDSANKVTNLDTFKAEMGEVRKNCGGCHQTYRKRT